MRVFCASNLGAATQVAKHQESEQYIMWLARSSIDREMAWMSSNRQSKFMFANGFQERHDLEQYIWTEATVRKLKEALLPQGQFDGRICCLTTPSLAHSIYQDDEQVELLLDIDERFSYLPGFRYFDLQSPDDLDKRCISGECSPRIIVFDPPFFYIPLEVLYKAVLTITGHNFDTKLMVGFLKREEQAFLKVFEKFNLSPTKFSLEYQTVKPNKWRNYTLYSNVDLPGIKRISATTKAKST